MLTTTWWSDGSKPGALAPHYAVILGHTQIGGPGAFNDLAKLRPGQVAGVTDGHILLKFRSLGKPRTGIPKKDPTALQRAINTRPSGTSLILLTCSGHFNGHESVENTVAYLELVSSGAAG